MLLSLLRFQSRPLLNADAPGDDISFVHPAEVLGNVCVASAPSPQRLSHFMSAAACTFEMG